MRKRRLFTPGVLALALVLIVLGSTGVIMAGGGPDIDIGWNVLAGGGGRATSGIYVLDNTVGQAAVASASGSSYGLCSGYWCIGEVRYRIYLPWWPQ